MMMMLSNSRVLVNGTTIPSVAKKSTTKVLLTLSSSLLSFVYSTAFIVVIYLKAMLWILSLSFLYE